MPKYSAPDQIVNPGESVIFTVSQFWPFPSPYVRHFDNTGEFLLNGSALRRGRGCGCGCGGFWPSTLEFPVFLGGNIAIPTGGTAGEISLAIARDGVTIPDSVMTVNPAAVEQFWSISHAEPVAIWAGCCQTISVRNTSTQPISIRNGSLAVNPPVWGNR